MQKATDHDDLQISKDHHHETSTSTDLHHTNLHHDLPKLRLRTLGQHVVDEDGEAQLSDRHVGDGGRLGQVALADRQAAGGPAQDEPD